MTKVAKVAARIKRMTKKKPKAAAKSAKKVVPIVPPHQWTNGGDEVLIVKCVNPDGITYNGFRWPLEVDATVEAPDWNPEPVCGGGLHGWPWGFALGDGKNPDFSVSAKWIVFGAAPSEIVSLDGKCKAKRAIIRFVGSWVGAMTFVSSGRIGWTEHGASGAASATGWSGAASATGWRGAASATGARGAASATGDCSVAAVTNLEGKARGGRYSAIALAVWINGRNEMRCAEIGCGDGTDGKLKANVWYALDTAGHFIETTPPVGV